MAAYSFGSFIKFTYNVSYVEDKFKEIFVLHPFFGNKVHGLDLKRMTEAEIEVLRAIMSPAQKKKNQREHKYPLVRDVLSKMEPWNEIKNPQTFYSKFVKPFIKNKDVYRTYYPARMLNVVILPKKDISKGGRGLIVGKPMFGESLFGKKEVKKPTNVNVIPRSSIKKQKPTNVNVIPRSSVKKPTATSRTYLSKLFRKK